MDFRASSDHAKGHTLAPERKPGRRLSRFYQQASTSGELQGCGIPIPTYDDSDMMSDSTDLCASLPELARLCSLEAEDCSIGESIFNTVDLSSLPLSRRPRRAPLEGTVRRGVPRSKRRGCGSWPPHTTDLHGPDASGSGVCLHSLGSAEQAASSAGDGADGVGAVGLLDLLQDAEAAGNLSETHPALLRFALELQAVRAEQH